FCPDPMHIAIRYHHTPSDIRYFYFSHSCFADLRDLHSFPTRRSSDLIAVAQERLLGTHIDHALDLIARVGHQVPFDDALDIYTRDRKSTRLNSSHVKISYAVFCLKKKKNKIARNILIQNDKH